MWVCEYACVVLHCTSLHSTYPSLSWHISYLSCLRAKMENVAPDCQLERTGHGLTEISNRIEWSDDLEFGPGGYWSMQNHKNFRDGTRERRSADRCRDMIGCRRRPRISVMPCADLKPRDKTEWIIKRCAKRRGSSRLTNGWPRD